MYVQNIPIYLTYNDKLDLLVCKPLNEADYED